MYIQIQAPTPYEQSQLWEQHREAYQVGGTAILQQDVPYNISSNPCLARQLLQLFRNRAELAPDGALAVLELGGGLGILALNFLRALEQEEPELLARTQYWLSDYALSTLQELAQHPAYQHWLERGQLKLVWLDGLQPEAPHDLEGQAVDLPPGGFQLIHAQYFFSTLPTAVIFQQGGQWYRQTLALNWWPLGTEPTAEHLEIFLAPLSEHLRQFCLLERLAGQLSAEQHELFEALQVAQEQLADYLCQSEARASLLEQPMELGTWLLDQLMPLWQGECEQRALAVAAQPSLRASAEMLLIRPLLYRRHHAPEQVEERYAFEPVAATELFATESEQVLVTTLLAERPLTTVTYAPMALRCLERLRSLLSPGGSLCFGDKGYAGLAAAPLAQPERGSRHGGTLAQRVNFPLFAAQLQHLGFVTAYSEAEANALQMLGAIRGEGSEAECGLAVFQSAFLEQAPNEISHALLEGGHALLRQENLEAALRLLLRALAYRPEDGTLQYLVALIYLNQEAYTQAIEILERSHDDVFGLLNRAVLLAEAYRLTGQYRKALPLYRDSLKFGDNALTHYQEALCCLELGKQDEARRALQMALALDPENTEVQTQLDLLSAASGCLED